MNPYQGKPPRAFWRPAVAERSLFALDELWVPKFHIQPDDQVVTFGSCFAQHIGKALKARGFAWTSYEPAPAGLSAANSRRFNYDIFSARTANIYTTTLLLQWVQWALGPDGAPDIAWEKDGRFYDPFRPTIEPGGFASREEMLASRSAAIAAFRRCIAKARYFVFTLGLTESWHDAAGGFEYPACPGTIAGTFDPDNHKFVNQTYPIVTSALSKAMKIMRKDNPHLRFLLTVSPVPLTATNSDDHVMVATMYSKSTLRAVAGDLRAAHDFVDYFPSFELINSPAIRGTFFEPNMREVNMHGVNFVMGNFFRGLEQTFGAYPQAIEAQAPMAVTADALVCEEILLEAFGPEA